jgi:glycosyltransferase involved in cell wall biosynthesis
MKVLHLALSNDGGAGIAAYRLHTALQEAGVESLMLTLYSKNADPTVKIIDTTTRPCLCNGPGISPHFYLYEQSTRCLLEQHPHRDKKRDIFTGATSEVVLEDIREIQEADIINLHWIAGIVDYARAGHIFKGKKVVVTLHAMNDFTGGCYYAFECLKYISVCCDCQQLGPQSFDYANHIFQQKLHGMRSLDLTAVSPSKWLADCAAKSTILSAKTVQHIPNGIPIDTFRPMESTDTRSYLQIPPDHFVILFGAFDTTNERKGSKLLTTALQRLSAHDFSKITVVTFGAATEGLFTSLPCKVKELGPVCDDENLALIYSMADLFVLPSMADNLPNSILESLACGTPVLAFKLGGIPEIIEHKQNGYLAVPFDAHDLARGIVWCMQNQGRLSAEVCTATIRYGYTDRIQALRYISLYQGLLGGSPRMDNNKI